VFEDAGYKHPRANPAVAGPGKAASIFDVTLQEPKQLRSLHHLVQSKWRGSKATFTSIEVAMDTYKPDADEFELGQIVADRLRWMEYTGTGKWHLYRTRGQVSLDRYGYEGNWITVAGDDEHELCIGLEPAGGGMSQSELVMYLATGWQLTDHDKWTRPAARYRLQVKTTDRAGTIKLPRDLWRARFEVTLQASVLPWKDLADLQTADFTAFGDYFRFRKPAVGLDKALDVAVRAGAHAAWQPGRPGEYEKPVWMSGKPFPLKYRTIVDADSELNKLIYDRLRNLGGRLGR
jgi:hypothetical protein